MKRALDEFTSQEQDTAESGQNSECWQSNHLSRTSEYSQIEYYLLITTISKRYKDVQTPQMKASTMHKDGGKHKEERHGQLSVFQL